MSKLVVPYVPCSLVWTKILDLLDIEDQGTDFCFWKLRFNTIYNVYSKKSPFKYYISIYGGGGV